MQSVTLGTLQKPFDHNALSTRIRTSDEIKKCVAETQNFASSHAIGELKPAVSR